MDRKSSKIKSTREIIGPIFWIKLIGLGSEGVGKTCLVRSFCDKKFSKSYYPTVGVDYDVTSLMPISHQVGLPRPPYEDKFENVLKHRGGILALQNQPAIYCRLLGSHNLVIPVTGLQNQIQQDLTFQAKALLRNLGFKIHALEGIEYRLNFWDFGGDPDYDLIRTELFKDTQGCMLIFDVTNKASFDKLESWLQEFYENGGKGAVVTVIGNKEGPSFIGPVLNTAGDNGVWLTTTEYPFVKYLSDKLHRQVSVEEGKKWATKNGCDYYETSAASKSGVKEILDSLLTTIVERRMIKPKWIGEENKQK